jgi:hypothetical protein
MPAVNINFIASNLVHLKLVASFNSAVIDTLVPWNSVVNHENMYNTSV